MRLSQLASLLFTVLSVEASSSILKDRDAERCVACFGLANHVDRRLADTEARANEPVSIGKRLNAAGEEVPNRIVLYGDS